MMSPWLRKWMACCVLLTGFMVTLGMPSAWADAVDELSDADRTAIRQAITSQMEAFKANDADRAFSFATPSIQDRFGDASRFVAMVKRGYMPVYRPRQVEFTNLLEVRGKPTQRLVVVGPENDVFSAYYMMEQQIDGSWRISGCILKPIGDRSI
ncbi:MAG: DUF4864 domain-containing protein [Geminicoccaceae bacterium]